MQNENNWWDRFSAKFGSWLATTWLYLILCGVVGAAFSVLLYMDGHFSMSLAKGASINAAAFMFMGWAFRFFAVSFLMAGERCKHKGIKGGGTFYTLGVLVSIIVCAHAIGIGLEALADKRDGAIAQREVAAVAAVTIDEQLAELDTQRANIETRLSNQVDPINKEINRILNDGLKNDDEADAYKERRTMLQDAANQRLDQIDQARLELIANSQSAKTQVAQVKSDAKTWAPLFVGMAQFLNGTREPTDWQIYLCGVAFIMFWVFVAEALVIFLPPQIYRMMLHDADNAPAKDPVRVEAGKKAANTRSRRKRQTEKIGQQAESYIKNYEHALRLARNTKWSADGIANSAFKLPAGGMEDRLGLMVRADLIPQEHVEWIMRRADVPEGKQNAVDDINAPLQLTNGEDKGDADDTANNTGAIS